MSDAPKAWESNRADATDALVGYVSQMIPRLEDKDAATKAIYEHVRKVRYDRQVTVPVDDPEITW